MPRGGDWTGRGDARFKLRNSCRRSFLTVVVGSVSTKQTLEGEQGIRRGRNENDGCGCGCQKPGVAFLTHSRPLQSWNELGAEGGKAVASAIEKGKARKLCHLDLVRRRIGDADEG